MQTSAAPYAGGSRGGTGLLEGLVRVAHRRLGPWYFHGLVVATGLLVVTVTVPLQNLTQVPLWTGSFEGWQYIGVFMAIAAASGPFVLGLVVVPRHRALLAHLRGQEVDPAAVWRECVTRLPATAALTSLAWGVVVVGGGVAFVGQREDFGVLTYPGAYAAHALILVGVAAFYLMVWELALLPITREVARALPAGFREQSLVTGRRRLILLNTSITFTVGCETAGLSVGFAGEHRSLMVVLVLVGLMTTYVGVLLALVSSSVTRRVDELADALNSAARGGAPMRMLPTSGDEFDSVGGAFNTMVGLLEDHAEELRGSRSRLVSVADATRRHIERDLHDGAQQHLALLSMQLGQLESTCAQHGSVAARVHEIRAELSAVVAEMRVLAHGIYPASLEAEGLPSALRAAARESDVVVRLDIAVESRWSHPVETAVYFGCWEVLQRARHAATGDATLEIALGEHDGTGTVELCVRPALPAEHEAELALFLQDRLGAVGGTLVTRPRGTDVVYVGRVPVR
ncbi:sensor histidine kinase [Nocardioides antri]|uniref:histidine kinase n=1 Tax=Nocardioides antri TaxID=2607659 RepID=A0A5B1MBK6_9ACTN|nr:histidine kinase [Nocardioides antri]KAA1429307.1 HAMP domain-containing protein [Nocardioides antri]